MANGTTRPPYGRFLRFKAQSPALHVTLSHTPRISPRGRICYYCILRKLMLLNIGRDPMVEVNGGVFIWSKGV